MKKLYIALMMISSLLIASVHAEVSITSQSYQKVLKKKKEKWLKASKVVPGAVVKYVNTLKNSGKGTAENLSIINAIPKHMLYVKGSAKCKKKCTITYSVDGGKTFNKPKKLFVKDKKTRKSRRAKAKEYTAIRWVVTKLKGKKKTTVEYKARLK